MIWRVAGAIIALALLYALGEVAWHAAFGGLTPVTASPSSIPPPAPSVPLPGDAAARGGRQWTLAAAPAAFHPVALRPGSRLRRCGPAQRRKPGQRAPGGVRTTRERLADLRTPGRPGDRYELPRRRPRLRPGPLRLAGARTDCRSAGSWTRRP
ncbi:MAG: hypothetical protein WDN45_18305 [Caulobacteraceae bacterium]